MCVVVGFLVWVTMIMYKLAFLKCVEFSHLSEFVLGASPDRFAEMSMLRTVRKSTQNAEVREILHL